MILRSSLRPFAASVARPARQQICKRTLIAAPKEGDGPLMSRRADRALPTLTSSNKFLRTMPLFLLVVGASALAIFNYQKSSSSVVTSSLYALRVNPKARDVLGEEIYFAKKIPWIWGTIDQMHGRIDIRFGVKGTKGKGEMRFVSERKTRMGYVSLCWCSGICQFAYRDGGLIKFIQFETTGWTLTTEDGQVIDLINEDVDPLLKSEFGR